MGRASEPVMLARGPVGCVERNEDQRFRTHARSIRRAREASRSPVSHWYRLQMAMTLRLTEDEAEALRAQAEIEHRSMQDVAREAVREYIARHAHLSRVHGALEVLTPRYEELLDRLGKA
ncbi:hypothetical protein GCM10009608_01010 [Pseudonocardia alaniniphila]